MTKKLSLSEVVVAGQLMVKAIEAWGKANMRPLYNPECTECIFLGSFKKTDLYLDLHTMGGKGGLMVVCSNKDGDYEYMRVSTCRERMKWWEEEGRASCEKDGSHTSFLPSWPTNEAFRRAVAFGLIQP